MKTQLARYGCLLLILVIALSADAQTTTKKTTTKSKSTKTSGTTTKSPPMAITVTLSSKCERNIMIFSGPKENLKDPKMKEVGGLSVNTLYLKTGDVVCIMDAKKKPVSCLSITKTSSRIEINSSGTTVTVQ